MTACLLHNEPTSYSPLARLSLIMDVAVAKASLNRANELLGFDPKRDELGMARLKRP